MGFKKVCFKCRKAFNIPDIQAGATNLICSNCGGPAICLHHKFKPPKTDNIKEWNRIKVLVDNGGFPKHGFFLH